MPTRLLPLFLGLLILAGLPVTPGLAAETASNRAIFLPLKINSEGDQAQLLAVADRLLAEAATAKGYTLLPRAVAAASYQDQNWPPGLDSLRTLLPKGYRDYLVTGSLTRLGDRLSLDLTVRQLSDPAASHTLFKEIDSEAGLADAITDL
ncbi:MAG TPA: hypothetical protein VLA15_01245, partial [Desulfurivibrionaceae bacterium]|nr:hypothetical protein [Desulfurivibrionaceae bacterium]